LNCCSTKSMYFVFISKLGKAKIGYFEFYRGKKTTIIELAYLRVK
jgi:hypothetical protein